MKNVNASFLQV